MLWWPDVPSAIGASSIALKTGDLARRINRWAGCSCCCIGRAKTLSGGQESYVEEVTLETKIEKIFDLICRFFEKFWLGGADPQTPRFWLGGAVPPQTAPVNDHP